MASVQGVMIPLQGGDPIPLVKDSVIIGRRPECDIQLDAANISGRHAELRLHKGTWYIIDLESTNGTKVNGSKVKRRKLINGDEIAIARKHLFRIDFDPEAISRASSGYVSEGKKGPVGSVMRPKTKRPALGEEPVEDLFEEEEEEHSFNKPLLEKAGLVHGSKTLDEADDLDDDLDEDLDDLDDLDSMIADDSPQKP